MLVFKTSAFNRSATSPIEFERVRIVLAVSGGFNLKVGLQSKIVRIAPHFVALGLVHMRNNRFYGFEKNIVK